MNLPYSKPVALALAILLAAPIPLAWANGNAPDKVLQNIYNDKGQLIGQTRNTDPVPAVPKSDPGYTISKLSHKTDNIDVVYPQVDQSSVITSVLVNYQLFQAPGRYVSGLTSSSKLNIDYTITRQEKDLISVVFRGEQTEDKSTKPLMTSVNYNLKTRIPVTPTRLIRNTDAARQGVTQLLQQAAVSQQADAPPAFSDKLGYYLTGKYVVFYYLPSETAAKFIELPVAIDLIRPYLADEYSSLAVTGEVNKDPRQVVADIDNSLASYQSVAGKRGDGDTVSDFTAYFADDQLVYAEETHVKGDYESSTEKYYFDDGKLVAYKKNGQNLVVPIGGTATVQREEASMFYDASLNQTNGELIINSTASKLPESYIKAAYTVAEEIQDKSAELLAATKK